MQLKTKTVTVYTTADGVEHADHMSATIHELKLIMAKNITAGEPADLDAIAVTVFNNKDDIVDLVKTFNKINSQKVR